MKKLKLTLSVLFTAFTLLNAAKDEKVKIKYGKIDPSFFETKACPIDSNANAMVISDIGEISFQIINSQIVTVFKRHKRVQIFNKEGFDQGNFEIFLYRGSGGSKEEASQIKGLVYNLVDGKIEKTKLSNSNIFKNELDKNHNSVKINMPNIQENSIIDLEYTVTSPYKFTLRTWYFQDEIPTIYSEYTANVIEWLHYKNWIEGYHPIVKNESVSHERFTVGASSSFDAEVTHMKYVSENVPSFKDEPRITTRFDYLTSIHFELQSTFYPWRFFESYSKDWLSINKTLLEDENFGVTLKNDGHLKDAAALIAGKNGTIEEKACMAYNHIKKNMVWNGSYRTQASSSIRKAYVNNEGTSGDINLNLVALCKKAGLDAYPLLVSTRNHGMIRPGLVSLTMFNHVITAVKTDDGYILMDATGKNCPYNLLPPNSLNNKGRLVFDGLGSWVDLYSNTPKEEQYILNLKLQEEDLSLDGTITLKANYYGAVSFRDYYKKKSDEDDFIADFESKLGNAELSEFTVENIDSLQMPVIVKSHINLTERVSETGDMLFISPKVINRMAENEFKREERTYPIDYNYPIRKQHIIRIILPEGYAVEELPEKMAIGMQENGAKYIYSAASMGNVIQLTNQHFINRTIFPGLEYPDLKKFNEMIVTKEAEQIVIKKIN